MLEPENTFNQWQSLLQSFYRIDFLQKNGFCNF